MNTAPIQPDQSPAPAPFNPARIANYYDQVHKASWGRRAAGLFAGATLGIIFGAGIGLLAACIPYALTLLGVSGVATAVAGAPLLTPIIALKSAAIYAGVGGFMGPAVATDVGSAAGAVAGGMAVREHQEILANGKEPIIAAQPSKDAGASGPTYFSWKPAAFFATVCAGFGAMTAATGLPLLQSVNTLLFAGVAGAALTGSAAVLATAAVFALFGALFGFKFGRFSSNLSNFYMKVLSDDIFKKKQPAPALATSLPAPQPSQAAPAPSVPEPQPEAAPQKTFATEPKPLTPEAVLAGRQQQTSVQPGI